MNNQSNVASAERLSLEQESWLPVSPRYKTELRIYLSGAALLLLGLASMAQATDTIPYFQWFAGTGLLLFLFLFLVWIPRRVHYTRYLRRDLDMHMQTGYWWHTTTSVAINRIQHLELTQGPVERLLNLNTLVLYTAGGSQSDLKLPGLETDTASQLKAQLLHQIAQEEIDNNEDDQ